MSRVRYQRRVKAAPHVAGFATPINTVLPVITGDIAGEESSSSTGTWTSADAFTYQWYLDGVLLTGETADTIETDEGWVGQTLTVVVCGGAGGGVTCVTALGVVLEEAPTYEGPLDFIPGTVGYSAARALSVDALGTALYTLRRTSDSTTQSFSSDASTGAAPSASIAIFIGPTFPKTGAVVQDVTDIVLTDATGVQVGQGVSGTDIPAGASVTGVAGMTVSIDAVPLGSNPAETLTFTQHGYCSLVNDQSGNSRNGSQATESLQPIWIADGGASKPALSYFGTDRLVTAEFAYSGGASTFVFVLNFSETDDTRKFLQMQGDGGAYDLIVGQYYNNPNKIYVTQDGEAVIWETSSSITSGVHLLEVQVAATGAIVILLDGANLTAVRSSGSNTPIVAADWRVEIQRGIFGTLASPLMEFLFCQQQDIGASARANIKTFYGIS